MKLTWTKSAQDDLRWIYLRGDNPAAALRVREALQKAQLQLQQFPLSGLAGRASGTRELTTSPLPYVIVYEVSGGEIYILSIWHGAQQYPPA